MCMCVSWKRSNRFTGKLLWLFKRLGWYCLLGWKFEALFTVVPFSRKSILMSSFMSQMTNSTTFFTDFLPESQCVSISWTVFQNQAHSNKPMFCPFVNISLLKIILCTYHTFFCTFYMVCISQTAKIWWQTSVQAWSSLFVLSPCWIAPEYFLRLK